MLPIWPERNAFHVRKPATLLCDLGKLQRHHSHVPRLLLSGWTVATYARGPGGAGRKPGFTLSIDRTFSICDWSLVPGAPNRRKFEVLNQAQQIHFPSARLIPEA